MRTLEYYLSLPYRIEIIPDVEEGGYTARYPDLPGCITCADTLEILMRNAEDAKKNWTAQIINCVAMASLFIAILLAR